MTDVKLWLLYNNTWNHLTLYKKKVTGSFKNVDQQNVFTNHIHIFNIYVCKENLALNNLQWNLAKQIITSNIIQTNIPIWW